MLTSALKNRKFLNKFISDDTAITIDNRLEKMAELLISEKSLEEFKKTIECNSQKSTMLEINKVENLKFNDKKKKIRSNSSPILKTKDLIEDVNRISIQIKEKGSKMRQQLTECLNTISGVQILKYHQGETKNLLGMTSNSMIADTETTMSNITTLVKGSKRLEEDIKRELRKNNSDCKKKNMKKILQASKRVRFILSDLYNNIVVLDTCLGKKSFKKLIRDFEKRNRERNPKQCILRSSKKNHFDLNIESDLPKLAKRERQKRYELVDQIFQTRMKYLKSNKKMMDLRVKLKKLGNTRKCRLCKQEIKAQMLLDHSRRCYEIKTLENSLFQINHWLMEKSYQALRKRNKIGFDTLMGSTKEQSPNAQERNENYISDSINKNLEATRRAFQSRRCFTQYDSANTSKDYSLLGQEEQKKKMMEIATVKHTIREGDKPRKLTAFGKAHQKKKLLEKMKNKNNTEKEQVKNEEQSNDDESCYGDRFDKFESVKSDKFNEEEEEKSNAQPSVKEAENDRELVDKQKPRKADTGQSFTGVEAQILVDPPIDIPNLEELNSNNQDDIYSASESASQLRVIKNEDENRIINGSSENAILRDETIKNDQNQETKETDLDKEPIRDDLGKNKEEEEKTKRQNSNSPEHHIFPLIDPHHEPDIDKSGVNKLLERKREEFKKKAKRKESSSFYTSKYKKRKLGEEKTPANPIQFEKEIDMLLLAKYLYSEIAK